MFKTQKKGFLMKIVCDKNQLNEAIQTVQRAVATKSNLPSVEGILFSATYDTLTLTGYDFEMGIKTTIPCEVEIDGTVVLSASLLANIVRKMSNEEISIDCDNNYNCKIKSGITEYNIKGIDPSDYPDFPSPSEDNSISLKNSLFSSMLDYVIYAVSNDDKRPAHTGVLIKLEGNKLTMVALDGYRLAICERTLDFEGDFYMIVPAKAMMEVRKIVGDKDGEITIYSNKRYVIFNAENYIVLSRLLEGEFLDYKKAIPQSFVSKTSLDTRELIDAVERVSLIITERLKNPLKVSVIDNLMKIKCSTELGNVYDEIEVEKDGEDIEIGFNNKYILDALKASRKDEVTFEFSGSLSPCKIVPKDGDDFIYLVLPVRYKND